jgi:multiple sugar transport system permease protein
VFELKHPAQQAVFYGLLALLGLFIFFPIFWMVSTSLKPAGEVFRVVPTLLPQQPTVENYVRALTEENILVYLRNSVITAGSSSVLTMLLAAYAGFSFAKYRYRGQRPLMYLLLSAQMFPFAVLLVSLYPMLNAWGLTDTYFGLIISYIVFALPSGTYILYAYFMQVPTELIEAARMDGASDVRILHTIIFPLSVPALITVTLYAFMWAWNDLLYALTLITSTHMRTLGPGLLLTYLGEFRNDWGGAMAASIVSSLPIIVVFMLLQRFFIRGLTAGAVKS